MRNDSSHPCVIYARSSRWNNTASVKSQIVACEAFARRHKLDVKGRFKDTVSGYSAPLYRRKGLQDMMAFVKEYGVRIILLTDISRLSRSVMQGVYLLNWFSSLGVVVYDISHLDNVHNVEPSLGWPYRKILYDGLIEAERMIHVHSDDPPQADADLFFKGKTAPLGYIAANSNVSVLEKDSRVSGIVQDVFRIALECAPNAMRGPSRGKSINYTALYDLLSERDDFRMALEALAEAGVNKLLHNRRSLVSFLQVPYYAGYSQPGPQQESNRVHEYYISEKEYNQLNRGHRCIELPAKHERSYMPMIRCACDKGNLHKNGGRVHCRGCNRSMPEKSLVDAITTTLGAYHLDRDTIFTEHLERRLKVCKFERFLTRLQDARDKVSESTEAVVDASALPKKAIDPKTLRTNLDDMLAALRDYHEKGYGALGVEWLESYISNRGRRFLENCKMRFSANLETGDLAIITRDHEIQVSPRPKSLEEIHAIVEERDNLRGEIRRLINANPWLKAVLEYDVGVASGDIWTDYFDMLLT